MRIVFMGSADLSCPSLEALGVQDGLEVAGVVTQPDRPRGRHLKVVPGPVRVTAGIHGWPVLTPENVNAPDAVDAIRALGPDLLVVIAYGQILKKELLALPPRGCLNLHASLLPKYRGASPIQSAIAAGETVTGVTAMWMNERMDAGDIVLQRETAIGDDDTGGSLHDTLAALSAEVLIETLAAIRDGRAARRPQTNAQATYAPKLKKEDGKIDWTASAAMIRNRIRAFNPWPCCFCEAPAGAGRTLRVLRAKLEPAAARGCAGEVTEADGAGPVVATGDGGLRLVEVQPEGRRVMSGADYLHGHGVKAGDVLG